MDSISSQIIDTVRQEFSDLHDVPQITRVVLRLLLAVTLAGLIGYERERRGSAAGLRTHMLVGLGACLFVLAPEQGGMPHADLSRVLQGIVSGIGFLGAGAVLKLREHERIHGLTTAASIWATAAIGVTVGMGREATALLTTVMVVVILAVLYRFERRIPGNDDHRRPQADDHGDHGDRNDRDGHEARAEAPGDRPSSGPERN